MQIRRQKIFWRVQNEFSWASRGVEIVKMYQNGCREMVAEDAWCRATDVQFRVSGFDLRSSSFVAGGG